MFKVKKLPSMIYSLSKDIYAAHLDYFNEKNTHTCERNKIEIDKRKISLLTHHIFSLEKKNHRNESRFLTKKL